MAMFIIEVCTSLGRKRVRSVCLFTDVSCGKSSSLNAKSISSICCVKLLKVVKYEVVNILLVIHPYYFVISQEVDLVVALSLAYSTEKEFGRKVAHLHIFEFDALRPILVRYLSIV